MENVTIENQVIVPKRNGVDNCEITQYVSCHLSRTRQCKANMVTLIATTSKVGAISRDNYVPRCFVSMNKYIMKEPDNLPMSFWKRS